MAEYCFIYRKYKKVVVVVIVWGLDLQLLVQSMHITLKLWVRIPLTARYTRYNSIWLATGQWFYPGTPTSSTNKTNRHDISEILLKVALNTITLNPNFTIINGRIIVLFIENIFDYFKDSWNEKIGQTLEVMVFMLSTLFQEYRGGQFYWWR